MKVRVPCKMILIFDFDTVLMFAFFYRNLQVGFLRYNSKGLYEIRIAFVNVKWRFFGRFSPTIKC